MVRLIIIEVDVYLILIIISDNNINNCSAIFKICLRHNLAFLIGFLYLIFLPPPPSPSPRADVSPYHCVGYGTIVFCQAMMSFEPVSPADLPPFLPSLSPSLSPPLSLYYYFCVNMYVHGRHGVATAR